MLTDQISAFQYIKCIKALYWVTHSILVLVNIGSLIELEYSIGVFEYKKFEFSGGKTNHLSFCCGRLFCLLALSLGKVLIIFGHFTISYDAGDNFTISYATWDYFWYLNYTLCHLRLLQILLFFFFSQLGWALLLARTLTGFADSLVITKWWRQCIICFFSFCKLNCAKLMLKIGN